MTLTYKSLKIEIPYNAIQVEDIDILHPINDHANLKIKLLIEEGKILEYLNKNVSEEKITVSRIEETGEETKLFVGKINEVFMSYEGSVNFMELQAVSYTKEFDIKKNSRTFCNLDMTYQEVITKVLEVYDKKAFTDGITNGQTIGEFILQYEETDWEFLKRIASHFNGVLLSEATEEYGRFHFGIPNLNNNAEINIDDYEVVKDIDSFNKRAAMGFEENYLQEYTTWDIVSPINLILGEKVLFNKVECVVAKIHTEVYKEEIRTIYTLGLERGLRTTLKVNHKIFGMSIPGAVKDVKGNTMSVHFEIDPEYETYSNQKYFTYAIESSAWYCMPEKESKVHIYFPTNEEKGAIAVHAVRSTASGGKYASKTQNPDVKSFSHTGGSEMKLTPSDMNFSPGGGGVSLNLAQSGDVSLNGQNINFTATENLELGMREGSGDTPPFRPQSVDISAKSKIEIAKGGIGIQMTDATFMKGNMIKCEGSIKDPAALPDEIANRNKDDEDKIKEINNKAKENMEAKVDAAKQKVGFGAIALAIGIGAVVAAATVLTGGLALVALGAGVAAAAVGASEMGEGLSDYSKSQSGDYSKSDNFMRDVVCGGNETIYNIVKYGSVLISSVAIAIGTGGAATEILAKMAFDGGGDVAFNMLADYADDGKLDNNIMDYVKSAVMSMSMSNINIGAMNKFKKLEKAGELSCKTLGKIRLASDITLDMAQQLATTGDANLVSTAIKKYVGNKICFSDPVDGSTGSLYIPATDIVLPDIHEEFKIERKYESVNNRIGLLGLGWTTNFETCLGVEGEKINVLCPDGHIESFYLGDDKWVNDKGGAKIYTLKQDNDYWIFKSALDKKTYKYNSSGKLINITDRHGNKLSVTYIGENIETFTTFSNYKLFFTYKDGKVIEIKDELGRTVQYKYVGDYLTDVIHVDKGITRYTYDDNGYISSITDQNGHTYTKNFFDKKGRVIRQDFPNDDTCKINYDDSEKEVTFYYTKSQRTEKTRFNADGLITHLFYEDGSTEEYKYDDYQNKIYIKDRNGFESYKVYDEFGNLLKETLPNGLITEYTYDENGNLIKETDNEDKEIIYAYDSIGNLIEKKTKISVGNWTAESYTYDSFGRILSKADGNENISKYEYANTSSLEGKQGKDPVRVITNSGYEYEYTYDKVGRNTEIKTDYGTIEFGYNNLNFVASIKDANGNVTIKNYDNMGNLTSLYTPNACIKGSISDEGYKYSYDHMDRLISIRNPLGIVEKNIRDSEGNIIKEINPNYYNAETYDGIGVEYVYDKDNRKIKTIYPDGGIERFFYDSNGNVIRHISPEYYNEETDNGLGYTYTYDSMNRLSSIINEEGITEKTFDYDLHGNIIKEIDVDGNATLFKYDLLGNLIEKRVPVEKVNLSENNTNGSEAYEIKYNVTCYEYDKNGNKITEKHGVTLVSENQVCNNYHEIYFEYDNENRLISVKDKYGAKALYKYDCLNNKTYESFKINDTTTKAIHYIYDKVGNLIQKKEEINGGFVAPENAGKNIWAITSYEYDKNGNITKIITPKGFEIGRVYDKADRIIEQHEKDEVSGIFRSYVYKYDKADNIINISEYSGEEAKLISSKFISENEYKIHWSERHENKKENENLFEKLNFKEDQKKKSYTYDAQNRLTHFINFSGNTTRLFYDKNDRIIKQVLPEQYDETKDDGVGTTYIYNLKGQVVEVKNALGETVTKNTYDPKGNMKTSIDGENNKVEYTYTLLGHIKDIVTPNSRKENKLAQSYKYDARGNITGITDGNGNQTIYLLDDWGRIIQITTPEGGVEKYTYDFAGNITSTTDANGGTIEYIYNSLGQVCEIRDQEGNSEYFYYDNEGNLTKHVDRNQNHVDRSYNLDRNIVSVKAYQIDEEAIALEVRKAEEVRLKAIEEANKKSEESFVTSPLAQSSRRRSFTERLKNRKEREEQEEKLNKTNTDEKAEDSNKNKLNLIDQRFKYNPDGTLKRAYTGNMQYEYAYNIEGMLEVKSASGRTLLSYTYDKNNNIKSIKDITGKSSIYSYDEADRVKLIQDDDKNNLAIYDYYKNDSIKTVTVGNGLKSDYTYDGDGNVQSLVTISSNGEVLIDYNYAYDLNGNRLQKVSSKHKKFYSYDSMNRLVDSSYDDRCESFTYDKVGNRLTKTTNDITEKYVYNVKNQLKELQNNSGINHFTYDKQGNTIKEETSTGNNIFEYNTLNRQVNAITKDGNTLVSRYDTEGLRCEIEENEKLTKLIFHKENVLVETDKDFNSISRFTRGYEVVAVDIAESSESSEYNINRYYYTADEQGSTTFITDRDQKVKNEYWYDAFGNVLEAQEEVHNRITYTGQQYDGMTQQYYLRARFYNPVIGRFTQEDVYRGDGLNLYAYCGNNPVTYYDPSGYVNVKECEGKSNTYPPRTLEAQSECQKVVDKVNEIKMNVSRKTQNKNPVVSVFTHEDGTVSVGISGNNQATIEFASKLQNELNVDGINKYTVFGKADDELIQMMETADRDIGDGNVFGACAEPKAVSAANKNGNPINGISTKWRFSEDIKPNPHKYKGQDVASISEMDPCKTCEVYEDMYMDYANSNKM